MSRKIHPGRTTAHVRLLVTDGASLTGIADASDAGYSTIRSLYLGEYQAIDDQLAARIATVTIDQCRRQRSTGRRHHNGQTPGPGDWTRHAACDGTDVELWFPDHPTIAKLNEGLRRGYREQTLLGVTGSGKTFTMANITSHEHVRQKMHFYFNHAITLAIFATTALDVKREPSSFIATHLCLRLVRKQFTDIIKDSSISGWVASWRSPNR